LVFASNAERRRTETASAHERQGNEAIRAFMALQPLWTSELCSIVERRADRTQAMLRVLAQRRASAERDTETHEARRRRWARMVRGLDRRIARAAEQETAWPD
jgi:hypothetical protein